MAVKEKKTGSTTYDPLRMARSQGDQDMPLCLVGEPRYLLLRT